MGFSFLPREDDYFTFFSEMGEVIVKASEYLVEMVESDPKGYEAISAKIKKAEHACDDLTHKITTKLNKSFITPFDREDIYTLVVALDDVCDYIDAGARAIVMYDMQEVGVHAVGLAKVTRLLANEINSAVALLKKPNGMNKHIVEIHRLENEADDIYFRAIGELFQKETDPITLIKYKELYEILENATDRCESVANIIESIVLKHN
ncbi:MAG: DUF47 domain-containing protein [Pyrinomonadaceae bacterium]|nr:DUF47 domain-containing protein [Pyrinomonadaceae bacterium]